MDARVVGVHLDIPCGFDGVGVEKILWHAALIFITTSSRVNV
jgi:hypothetical protein